MPGTRSRRYEAAQHGAVAPHQTGDGGDPNAAGPHGQVEDGERDECAFDDVGDRMPRDRARVRQFDVGVLHRPSIGGRRAGLEGRLGANLDRRSDGARPSKRSPLGRGPGPVQGRPTERRQPQPVRPTSFATRLATMICCSRVAWPARAANSRPPKASQVAVVEAEAAGVARADHRPVAAGLAVAPCGPSSCPEMPDDAARAAASASAWAWAKATSCWACSAWRLFGLVGVHGVGEGLHALLGLGDDVLGVDRRSGSAGAGVAVVVVAGPRLPRARRRRRRRCWRSTKSVAPQAEDGDERAEKDAEMGARHRTEPHGGGLERARAPGIENPARPGRWCPDIAFALRTVPARHVDARPIRHIVTLDRSVSAGQHVFGRRGRLPGWARKRWRSGQRRASARRSAATGSS